MRFSIRPAEPFKYKAEVGGVTIVIRKRLWPLRFYSGEWYWTWLDGTRMVLTYKRENYRCVRRAIFADGALVYDEMIRYSFISHWRWQETTWRRGERRLTHRRVPRRATSWRGMFALLPRNVLNSNDGRTPISWSDDCGRGWQGVIRSSLDGETARMVFGIVVALCLHERRCGAS
ncbi:MAG TPA: hypothetical protein VF278_21155 [Pirellulales bacterium]